MVHWWCSSLAAVFLLLLCITRITAFLSLSPFTHIMEASNQRPRRSRRIERKSLANKSEPEQPLFSMGLLADIQYAPIDDGHSYSGTPRYYRHALAATQHAAQHFQDEQVDLAINLGDLVDGKCNRDHSAVDDVIKALSVYQGPILHTYGNHCLYNMDRSTISSKLGIPFVQEPCGDLVGYYSHVFSNFRFIVLDSYDVAMMQRCEKTSEKRKEAVQLLQRHNSENYAAGLENSPEGLVGVQKRFVAFNGAVGKVQLRWLESQLESARRDKQKVIVLSHQPILPGSTSPVCLMWNYKDVVTILRAYKDVVVASFAGHAHKGGYQRDIISGIHFRVFEAVLENPDPHKTYALIDVYDDHLDIKGYGNCSSATYRFDHQPLLERQEGR